MNKVMIESATYRDCQPAVEKAFDLFPLDIEGKSVLIKPNALRGSTPEQGVTTHPSVLQAVVDKVISMKPSRLIVGDNCGMVSYGANEETFDLTGLKEASRGHYQNIGTEGVEFPMKAGKFSAVNISKEVMDADVVISVPKFKTHGLTVMSGAIKNNFGYVLGAQKAELHYESGDPGKFAEFIVDIFNIRPPDLMIMDGVLCMEGNGPASTELRFVGKIIAADNAVAMDATVSRIMGLEPLAVPVIRYAVEKGLGSADVENIEIIGELKPIPEYRLPPNVNPKAKTTEEFNQFLRSRFTVRPTVNEEFCTACGTCVDQCPADALEMGDMVPIVDKSACIACFCCQEMCPEAAIELK